MSEMRSNTKTNNLIRNLVVAGDFVVLALLFYLFVTVGPGVTMSEGVSPMLLFMMAATSLAISEYFFSTVIHRRRLKVEQVLRQVTLLVFTQCVVTYLLTKAGFLLTHHQSPHSLFTLYFTFGYYPLMLVVRLAERLAVKQYRRLGGNTRTALLVGSDQALLPVYQFLSSDPATGYRVLGYYANHEIEGVPDSLVHLGTLADFEKMMQTPISVTDEEGEKEKMVIPDELYCSLSWSKRDHINCIRKFCDRHVIHFYFIPVFAESFGHSLKIEQIGETVGYTNYIDPLQLPTNQFVKRIFDVAFSLLVLIPLLLFSPIIALIIKLQSPGPIFFRQLRTGMNGRSFYCYKFRSMHVNDEADRLQATKDDPRKFPFGNFMRKANIDELPQFWNVLKGDMSIVGPRPHMLAHTEQYSQLIDKYMVRHFVKPGVTGWAQVTGFRGETKELWQMEGRVKRDIWYIENWSFWLDLRIIWMTIRQVFVHDEQAY